MGLALLLGGSDDRATEARPVGAAPPAKPARGPVNPPVVFLLLDEFPADMLIGRGGRIDPVRYPNFARLAREGYWFPNATTVYDSTTKAAPTIMDGRMPRDGTKAVAADHPHSIYTMLGRRGYRVVNSEEATRVCPDRYCPGNSDPRPEDPPQPRLRPGEAPERLDREDPRAQARPSTSSTRSSRTCRGSSCRRAASTGSRPATRSPAWRARAASATRT